MTSERLFDSFIPPKLLYPQKGQNKFLATSLELISQWVASPLLKTSWFWLGSFCHSVSAWQTDRQTDRHLDDSTVSYAVTLWKRYIACSPFKRPRLCERWRNSDEQQSGQQQLHAFWKQHDNYGAITSKIKHAIKRKTSPARLAQLLHNCCCPH